MRNSNEINLFIEENLDSYQLYKPHEHIFTQGDPFQGIYYILEGSVKIIKNNNNQPLVLWLGEKNEFIGITSYFENSDNYQFTAKASELSCKLIYISSDNFSELINRIPGIKEEIMKVFCKRLNFVELRINNFMQNNPKQRFIDTITFIIKHMNPRVKNQSLEGTVFNYSLNDLSEMVGTSKNTMKEIIEEFEHKNLLRVQDDTIIIFDPIKLQDIEQV